MYLNDPRNGISSDDEKIEIAISYMEGPKVKDWVEWIYNTQQNEQMGIWGISWREFKQLLNNQWMDKSEERNAQELFEQVQQRADFFTWLELILAKAKHNKESSFIIARLKRICDQDIVDEIIKASAATGGIP